MNNWKSENTMKTYFENSLVVTERSCFRNLFFHFYLFFIAGFQVADLRNPTFKYISKTTNGEVFYEIP